MRDLILLSLGVCLPALTLAQTPDWPKINDILKEKLEAKSPAMRIRTQEQFTEKVDKVIKIITGVLNKNLEELKPNPFSRRW